MSSSSRRPDRPIESVALRISITANGETSRKIKKAVPEAVLKNGRCEVVIEGERPAEVEEKARAVLEKLRALA